MFLIVIDHFLEIVVLLSFLLYLVYDKFTSTFLFSQYILWNDIYFLDYIRKYLILIYLSTRIKIFIS